LMRQKRWKTMRIKRTFQSQTEDLQFWWGCV